MAAVTSVDPVVVETVSLETVRRLTEPHPAPCLSLYLPTHRNVPGNTVDRPSFRHLVESLQESLALSRPRDEIERLLRPFHLLADDRWFWEHTHDGLAVLAADGQARVFLLPRPVPPLAMVTPRFHTLPLVRIAASIERFHVLALTSREAHVYEGFYEGAGAAARRLVPVRLGDGEAASAGEITRSEAVDAEIIQPHRVKHGMGPGGVAAVRSVHGGFGSKQDDVDADTEIFLRHVDEVVHEQVSRQADLPLVLVALSDVAAMFRGLSKNRMLLDDYVPHDPKLLTADDLAARVMPIFDAARQRRISRALHTFEQARDRGLAASDLAEVGRAAVTGRVATLLIESDRFETGLFDRTTGAIEPDGTAARDLSRTGDEPAIDTEDLFGAVAEEVLLHGGGILSLDRLSMPTESGVAAIYRYA